MKQNNAGFSLVELLVMSIILTLLSVFSISTFQTNRQEQSIRDEIGLVSQTSKNLDNQLGSTLTDYTITFMTGAYYLVESNTLSENNPPKVVLSGSILNIIGNPQWQFYTNSEGKQTVQTPQETSIILGENKGYDIKGYIDNKEMIKIKIIPYALIDASDQITLQSIEDSSGNIYTSGSIIHSFQGDKQYIFSGSMIFPPLKLQFQVNGDAMEYQLEK